MRKRNILFKKEKGQCKPREMCGATQNHVALRMHLDLSADAL